MGIKETKLDNGINGKKMKACIEILILDTVPERISPSSNAHHSMAIIPIPDKERRVIGPHSAMHFHDQPEMVYMCNILEMIYDLKKK